jgi:hypothetical protein
MLFPKEQHAVICLKDDCQILESTAGYFPLADTFGSGFFNRDSMKARMEIMAIQYQHGIVTPLDECW